MQEKHRQLTIFSLVNEFVHTSLIDPEQSCFWKSRARTALLLGRQNFICRSTPTSWQKSVSLGSHCFTLFLAVMLFCPLCPWGVVAKIWPLPGEKRPQDSRGRPQTTRKPVCISALFDSIIPSPLCGREGKGHNLHNSRPGHVRWSRISG